MEKIINRKTLYNYQFAYGFHKISYIYGKMIEFNLKSGDFVELRSHIERLIESKIEENLNNSGKLLLLTNYETKLLEECSNCKDPSTRLDLIFELRKRGKTFFNIEIEEFILASDNFHKQLHMLERYFEETGIGYKVYEKLFNSIPNKRREIIRSVAKIGLKNFKNKIEKICNVNDENFMIEALFCMGVFDSKYTSKLIKDYIIKYKGNRFKIDEFIDGFIDFLSLFDDKKHYFSEKIVELFISDLMDICEDFNRKKCFKLLNLGIKYPSSKIFSLLNSNILKDDDNVLYILKFIENKLNNKKLELFEVEKFQNFPDYIRNSIYLSLFENKSPIDDMTLIKLIEIEKEKENTLKTLLKFIIENKKYKLPKNNYKLLEKIFYETEIYKENYDLISMLLFIMFKINLLREKHFDRLFIEGKYE